MNEDQMLAKISEYKARSFVSYYRNEGDQLNTDYILALNLVNNQCVVVKEDIPNNFQEDLAYITNVFNLEEYTSNEHEELYDYISTSQMLERSRGFFKGLKEAQNLVFDFAISLTGTYLSKINVDIHKEAESFKTLIDFNQKLFEDSFYFNKKISTILKYNKNTYFFGETQSNLDLKPYTYSHTNYKLNYLRLSLKDKAEKLAFEEFQDVKDSLIQEFCGYLLYWLKAYNLDEVIDHYTDNNPNNIVCSHRILGWVSARHRNFDDLTFELISNFGYGGSSHFYLVLKYKDIEIVQFMDWITYPIAEMREILQYTKRLHRFQYRSIIIDQESWFDAMEYLATAFNTFIEDEKKFVDTYVINQIDGMINELYKIFDMDDKHLHERYRTNSAYRLIRTKAIFNTIGHVEDLEIKAIKICGALGFIGKLTEIDKILETSSYIDRIKDVNKKLLPLLESSLINCQDSLDLLREIEDELQQEINLVYNESESPTNLKFLKIQKERLSPKEFLETYPNYHEIERKYRALRNNLFENHSDKTKVDTFIKNIEKYISTVEDYCAEA